MNANAVLPSQPQPVVYTMQERLRTAAYRAGVGAIASLTALYLIPNKYNIAGWIFLGGMTAGLGMAKLIRSCNGTLTPSSVAWRTNLLFKLFLGTKTLAGSLTLGWAFNEFIKGVKTWKLSEGTPLELRVAKFLAVQYITGAIGFWYPEATKLLHLSPGSLSNVQSQLQQGRHVFFSQTLFPWLLNNDFGATPTGWIRKILGIKPEEVQAELPWDIEALSLHSPDEICNLLLDYSSSLQPLHLVQILKATYSQIGISFIQDNFPAALQRLIQHLNTNLPELPVTEAQLGELETKLRQLQNSYDAATGDQIKRDLQICLNKIPPCEEFKKHVIDLNLSATEFTNSYSKLRTRLTKVQEGLNTLIRAQKFGENLELDPVSYLCGTSFNEWATIVRNCALTGDGPSTKIVYDALKARGITTASELTSANWWPKGQENNPDAVLAAIEAFLGKAEQPLLISLSPALKRVAIMAHILFQNLLSVAVLGAQISKAIKEPGAWGFGFGFGLFFRKNFSFTSLTGNLRPVLGRTLPSVTQFCNTVYFQLAAIRAAVEGKFLSIPLTTLGGRRSLVFVYGLGQGTAFRRLYQILFRR